MTGQQSPENRIHPPALFRRPLHILHHHDDTFPETFIGQRTDIKRDFHLPENEVFQFLGGEFDSPAIDYVIKTPIPEYGEHVCKDIRIRPGGNALLPKPRNKRKLPLRSIA